MRLTFGDITEEVNVFNLGKQPRDMNDQTFEVNSIENLMSEREEIMEINTGAILILSPRISIWTRSLIQQWIRRQAQVYLISRPKFLFSLLMNPLHP